MALSYVVAASPSFWSMLSLFSGTVVVVLDVELSVVFAASPAFCSMFSLFDVLIFVSVGKVSLSRLIAFRASLSALVAFRRESVTFVIASSRTSRACASMS